MESLFLSNNKQQSMYTIDSNGDFAYKKLIRTVDAARRVADDYEASIELIEKHMRKLYFHEFTSDESIEVYLLLESKWKTLTGFRASNGPTLKYYTPKSHR